MYYVMREGNPMQLSNTIAYNYQPQAIHRAETLFKQTGRRHVVVKVESVWLTSKIESNKEA